MLFHLKVLLLYKECIHNWSTKPNWQSKNTVRVTPVCVNSPVHMWLWWGIFPGITPPDVKSKCVNWWLEARENILERVFDPRPVVTPNPTQPIWVSVKYWFSGQKRTFTPHQELAQQHEKHKHLVFLVSRRDVNKNIGGCPQRSWFRAIKQLFWAQKGPFWAIGAMKRPAERPKGHILENWRCPELPQDMEDIWSH